MCEMLVERVGQRNLTDPIKDARLLKAGHVIVICPDGWDWKVEERNNPNWVIISTPMSMEEAREFVIQEEDDITNPLCQIRRTMLDFDALPNGIASRLRASRASERAPIAIGLNSMREAKKAIPRLANPLVAR